MPQPSNLILASASPRRARLLAEAGYAFRVIAPGSDETHRPGESPGAYVRRNAGEKAAWVRERFPACREAVLLAADTVVVGRAGLLEKPDGPAGAVAMLRSLSGHAHEVITGVCLLGPERLGPAPVVFAESTRVVFRALTDEEIEAYVQTGEPLDKAGAYAIQGGAAAMVDHIEGSWSNVVGLPMEAVRRALAARGVQPVRPPRA